MTATLLMQIAPDVLLWDLRGDDLPPGLRAGNYQTAEANGSIALYEACGVGRKLYPVLRVDGESHAAPWDTLGASWELGGPASWSALLHFDLGLDGGPDAEVTP